MVSTSSYKEITKCRLCKSADISSIVDFGNIPLGNDLQTNQSLALKTQAYPLCINRCSSCEHFQLSVSVNPEKLYATNYTYLSGIGKSFVSHLETYSDWVCKEFSLGKNSLIVDVGSNDGTCLKFFKQKECKVLGVDPATLPSEIANKNNIPTINSFFNDETVDYIIKKYGQADFITSHNVLAHVYDLRNVFANIFRLLKYQSTFIFEIGYFRMVLENDCFDTTYHEHLDYHHAKPLTKFLRSLGFDVIDLTTNSVQGGSLRIQLKKTGDGKISKKAEEFINLESESILYNEPYLTNWAGNIETTMSEFGSVVKEYVMAGHTIAGYGVPTKATLLLTLSNLNINQIPYIVEDNSLKVGRFLPITGIPIFNVDELEIKKPEIIIIFAWNFANDIVEKLRKFVNWKCKIIVPLPYCKEIEL
ncbi:hypothetical protein CL656_06775 [bacterium]|nr:hypothetical protein [bacterium]|tara:strand:+ start:87 stop:1343 length:1257 start_codon:yes stop_codon:yes gene_type:complete